MSGGTNNGGDFTFNDNDNKNEQKKCFEVTRASTKELAAFIKEQYDEWKSEESFLDYELWATFTEIFKPLRHEQWAKLNSSNRGTLSQLRNILRNRGVWVDNEAKQDTALFNCAQEQTRGQWSPNEIDLIKESGGTPTYGMLLQVKNYQSRAQRYDQIDPSEKKLSQSQSSSEARVLQQQTNTPYANVLQSHPYQSSTTLPLENLKTQPNNYNQQTIGVQALTNLAKLYSEPMKYTGEQDSFKYKVKIFEEKCAHAGINDDQGKAKAFSTMLTSDSLSYFYTLPHYDSFAAICLAMTNHFEGPESKVNAVNKWNSLNLLTRISSDPQKTTAEHFEAFVSELRQLQYKLPDDLLTEQFLHMKLMTACREVPACVLACYKPAPDLPTFINDLRNSIGTKETSTTTTESYYADRRFCSSNEQRFRNDPRRSTRGNQASRIYSRDSTKENSSSHYGKGKCWVCKKQGCRSYYHSDSELNKARERFHKGADQYLAEYDDYLKSIDETEEDNDNPTEHNEIYDHLILDMKSPRNDATHQARDSLSHDSDNQLFANTASAEEIVQELANNSFLHSISHGASTIGSTEKTYSGPIQDNTCHKDGTSNIEIFSNARYSKSKWFGILIDTGAANRSTVGYNQYIAFKTLFGIDIDPSPKFKVNIRFGIGTTTTIGAIHVETPIGLVDFYVAQTDTPFLLSLADLDNLKVYFNSVDDILVSTKSNKRWSVIRLHGHAWLLWDAPFISFICESFTSNPSFLSDIELRRLHKRFGHPSVERLHKLLEKSNHEVDKVALERLTRYCSHCQKHGKSPGRFRFTLRDDVQFNYAILVDVMYIGTNPVLHVIDEYTRFQAARWLQNVSAKHTWDQLRSCWIDTYLGPPDLITHDAGKNFISQEFKQYAHDLGTTTKVIPVEAHWSIGMIERYHTMLRRAYGIISIELPELNKDMQLQMAVKAINDTAGPNGLVPTLLVFGAYPRMTNLDAPAPTVALRINALKKAQTEIKKVRAEKLIASALNHRNGPSTTAIHDLPLHSDVLVFREGNGGKSGTWQGPYKLIALDNEDAIVNINSHPTSFRTTALRPYLVEPPNNPSSPSVVNDHSTSTGKSDQSNQLRRSSSDPSKTAIPFKRTRGRPRKYPLHAAEPHLIAQLQEDSFAYNMDCDERFRYDEIEILSYQTQKGKHIASRKTEVEGLMKRGVFMIVHENDVPKDKRIFNSRFIDTIKNPGTTEEIEKSRLVIQAWGDNQKHTLLTQSPTIQRASQRIILALAMLLSGVKLYSRDITQAYVQSQTKLQRKIYVRPPPDFGVLIPKNHLLMVVRPLYGIPESGNHWFSTYHKHHTSKLDMNVSTFDPCLLFCKTNGFGVVGMQTDDTLILADSAFAAKEEDRLKEAKFAAKERYQLNDGFSFKFNGGLINLKNEKITLTQEHQCQKISLINENFPKAKQEYIAQRARGAYVASTCQPEASFDLSFAAQANNPEQKDIQALNKRLKWQLENMTRGLTYVRLDIETVRLLIFSDASFANNHDLTSQIGYIIVLADANDKANILHWSSIKCKRVTRSVLASELYAMVHGFDIGSAIKATLDIILDKPVPLIVCTDSKSLYDCLVKLGTTQEKRLMIDVMSLRQSYENREIAEVKWIAGKTNPADSMTKSQSGCALTSLINNNIVDLQISEWVERPIETNAVMDTHKDLPIENR